MASPDFRRCSLPRQISGRRVACLDGPGRCVCRWAAARPRAVRAASFARRVDSLSGQALPPPTRTAAGFSGALHAVGAWLLMCGSRVVSKPGQASPPPTGTAARPSGALHTGGTCVAWTSPARPRRRPPVPRQVPSGTPVPSRPAALVSLGLAQPGLAAAHRHCGQARVLKPGQAPRRPPIGWGLSLFVASALIAHRLAISHVIPLCVLQTMNLYRCNCNVCGWSRKVTAGNYVRLLFSLGPAATRRHRRLAPRHGSAACPVGTVISHAIPF